MLLVDDDARVAEAGRKALTEHGYEVRIACSGKACMEQATGDKPDLIVLEMIMQNEVIGFDLSRELRNCEHTKSIPLVAIASASETFPFRIEPDQTWLPVDALIEKPVEPQALLDVVDRILGKVKT